MPVIKDAGGELHSRRSLILERANKDGGAHVDPTVKGKYARLSRQNGMGQYRGGGDNLVPMGNPVTPAIRQIAYEAAVSLNHRSEEHTSELQSLMRISYAVFCLKKKKKKHKTNT